MSNQTPTTQAAARGEALIQLVDFLAVHRRRLERQAAEQAERERDARQSEAQRALEAPRS